MVYQAPRTVIFMVLPLFLAASGEVCEAPDAIKAELLLQQAVKFGTKAQLAAGRHEPTLKTVGWSPDSLQKVRGLLASGESTLPAWAASAKKVLASEAERRVDLPANLRSGVSAGPWSVTKQGPTPPSPGTARDYATISGYYWPCNATCPVEKYGATKCHGGWVQPTGGCDPESGLPAAKHDGFLNYANLEDLEAMIVMMDTVEALTLAWWLLPEHNEQFAEAATKVLRTWFFDGTLGMTPQLLYGGGIPGIYDGTAGALIAPSFRLGTRLSDCVELLKTADEHVWTASDNNDWEAWASAWSNWMENSEFGVHELGAVGNHATFMFSHKLALAKAIGNETIILDVVSKIRTGLAGSLDKQIIPSGEMPIETARVAGKTYSLMNLRGLFQLGVAVENACRDLDCAPSWDWNFEVIGGSGSAWKSFPDKISYCKFSGQGSKTSVDACKASCMASHTCNGVVTRVVSGKLFGCYFKLCSGTLYRHRPYSKPGVFTSYHYEEGPKTGSGSVRKALDFLRPYALGDKSWSKDFPNSIDGGSTWRDLALPLRIAANKLNRSEYEEEISAVDPRGWFTSWTYDSLMFPPAGTV